MESGGNGVVYSARSFVAQQTNCIRLEMTIKEF